MQSVDFTPPAPNPPPSPERALFGRTAEPSAPGHFASIMRRALAHESDDDSDAAHDRRKDDSISAPKKRAVSSAPDPTATQNAGAAAQAAATIPDRNSPPPPPASGDQPASGIAATSAVEGDASEGIAAPANGASDSAKAELVAELSGPSESDATEASPETAQTVAAAVSENLTGISGAKHAVPMQKADNTNEFSGLNEQKMPVAPAVEPAGDDLPAKAAHPRVAAYKLQEEKSETATAPTPPSSVPVSETAESAAVASADWPSSVRSVERTHDLMALHGTRIRESGQESLQVVIKPDAGLQLSLQLQMRQGAVEIRALLDRGNFEMLNLHWPELQQQLEARGIRLAPLATSDPTANGSNEFSQHSQERHAEDQTRSAGAFADFALNSTLVPASKNKNRTPTPRGWESWA